MTLPGTPGKPGRALATLTLWLISGSTLLVAHSGPPYPIVSSAGVGPYVVSVWTDPDIGIDWPAGPDLDPVLSDKDAAAPPLSRLDSPFAYAPLPWERAAPALRGAGR